MFNNSTYLFIYLKKLQLTKTMKYINPYYYYKITANSPQKKALTWVTKIYLKWCPQILKMVPTIFLNSAWNFSS